MERVHIGFEALWAVAEQLFALQQGILERPAFEQFLDASKS